MTNRTHFIHLVANRITHAAVRDINACTYPHLDLVDLVNFHFDMYPDPMPTWFNTMWFLVLKARIYRMLDINYDHLLD